MLVISLLKCNAITKCIQVTIMNAGFFLTTRDFIK